MPDAAEEQLLIQSDSGTLNGILYTPKEQSVGAVLFCDPLFEERKSSQRVMVDCARALCSDGFMVLRFDYRGCGDSHGDFRDFVPNDWVADIESAARTLMERSGSSSFGLLGLRLGANLAVRSILAGLAPDFLVLWEPIPDGNDFIEHELRRKLLREMVTFGKGRDSRDNISSQLEAGQSADLDGYELTPALFAAIKKISLEQDLVSNTLPTLLCHITHGDNPSPGMSPLQALLKGSSQSFTIIKEQPFWNRIGLVKCTELEQKTRSWIKNYK